MAKECIDLKRMQTTRYRTYRVMRASGVWLNFYQKRIEEYGKYNALIFPEMFLGLKESARLYIAAITKSANSNRIDTVISTTVVPKLFTEDYTLLLKTSDIENYESENNTKETAGKLIVQLTSSSYNDSQLITSTPLFTNKRDVLKYVTAALEKHIGGL